MKGGNCDTEVWEMARKAKETKVVAKRKPSVEVVDVEEVRIDEAVGWINKKITAGVHSTYLEIGNYVFEQFFEGDLAQVKSFNPHKASSFRKLAERADIDLMISKSHLQRAVQVAIQERHLLPTVPTLGQLPFSHKALLLPIKDDAKKGKLAVKAIEEQLTYKKLQELVNNVREKQPKSPAGRPVLPGFMKSITRTYSVFAKEGSLAGLDEDSIKTLGKEDLAELEKKLTHILTGISRIKEAVEKALTS